MPLSVDLEADLEEVCVEHLRPWPPLRLFLDPEGAEVPDGDGLDLTAESFEQATGRLASLSRPLRALRIVGKPATPAELTALLRVPALARLEALLLPLCPLGPEGAKAIVDAPLPALRLLDLRQTKIGDEGAVALAKSALGRRLEHLAVAGSFLTMAGLTALLASPLGARAGALHVEEEDQPESLLPTMMTAFYEAGGAAKAKATFAKLLGHPALTAESRKELRYQWDLITSN